MFRCHPSPYFITGNITDHICRCMATPFFSSGLGNTKHKYTSRHSSNQHQRSSTLSIHNMFHLYGVMPMLSEDAPQFEFCQTTKCRVSKRFKALVKRWCGRFPPPTAPRLTTYWYVSLKLEIIYVSMPYFNGSYSWYNNTQTHAHIHTQTATTTCKSCRDWAARCSALTLTGPSSSSSSSTVWA